MASVTVFKGSQEGVAKKHTTTKPDQLTTDYVLVRVTASGLCGTGKSLPSTHFAFLATPNIHH